MHAFLLAAALGIALATAGPAAAQHARPAPDSPPRADSAPSLNRVCALTRPDTATDAVRPARPAMLIIVPDTAAYRMPTLRTDPAGYAMARRDRRRVPAASDSLVLRRSGVPDTVVACAPRAP